MIVIYLILLLNSTKISLLDTQTMCQTKMDSTDISTLAIRCSYLILAYCVRIAHIGTVPQAGAMEPPVLDEQLAANIVNDKTIFVLLVCCAGFWPL